MTILMHEDKANPTVTDAIQEVCEQNKAEPETIWDALEAKGIDATPGLIYQAFHNMNAPGQSPSTNHAHPIAVVDGPPGLGAEDLALLGQLAAKAGGIEPLRRILAVWQQTPR